MRVASLFAAACVAATPMAASAQTIPVDRFTAVELHGGGTVTIRPGPAQRVTLVRGDPHVADFHVTDRGQGSTLVISPCKGFCWGAERLEVEIETPTLTGAAIMGGGHVLTEGAFPGQGAVSATIHGGGDIDLRKVPARAATAAIHGGGKILVTANDSLTVDIFGGGTIRYAGHPTVNSSIHGGGHVAKID
jgi:hypothetical protein